ncbi:hypothetical protein WN944_024192 [Citrus x changshan-huyou]|uniref:NADP-dependent oxidoreductase domain-containing protein n=1 Tax=Citrus x changshan-huyou TaxID=2935761 RepID=A0AAP0QCD1_9ROSI
MPPIYSCFLRCAMEKRLRNAYEKLKKRGIPLASNQVNYSLIYRKPEENGVKAACDELGITLIAYCPIAQDSPIFAARLKASPPTSTSRGLPTKRRGFDTHTQTESGAEVICNDIELCRGGEAWRNCRIERNGWMRKDVAF